MDTIEEVLELLNQKITETQEELDIAEVNGEESELQYLEGLSEAYTLVESAINYQRER